MDSKDPTVKEEEKTRVESVSTTSSGSITIKPADSLDILAFFKEPEVKASMLLGTKELMMMSVKVEKWNKYQWPQERNVVITNFHIYMFNKKKLKRVIRIQYLDGLTKNLQ